VAIPRATQSLITPARRPQTAHVGGHQPVPFVVRRLDDPLEQEAARVVDDDVEASEAGHGQVDRSARGVRLGGVRAQGGDPIIGELLDGRVDVLGDDLRAGRTELGDDLAADPAGGAGDDRHGASALPTSSKRARPTGRRAQPTIPSTATTTSSRRSTRACPARWRPSVMPSTRSGPS
jgi:hypothetical protein